MNVWMWRLVNPCLSSTASWRLLTSYNIYVYSQFYWWYLTSFVHGVFYRSVMWIQAMEPCLFPLLLLACTYTLCGARNPGQKIFCSQFQGISLMILSDRRWALSLAFRFSSKCADDCCWWSASSFGMLWLRWKQSLHSQYWSASIKVHQIQQCLCTGESGHLCTFLVLHDCIQSLFPS